MTRLLLLTAALTLAACGDREPEVVEAAPGGEPTPVSDTRAEVATTAAAVALGLTREELEGADLLTLQNTDLGDIETLVVDPSGRVTGVVVELTAAGDRKVVAPIERLTSVRINGEADLQTALTAAELQALPAYAGD
jgi:hypothetical protein